MSALSLSSLFQETDSLQCAISNVNFMGNTAEHEPEMSDGVEVLTTKGGAATFQNLITSVSGSHVSGNKFRRYSSLSPPVCCSLFPFPLSPPLSLNLCSSFFLLPLCALMI